MNCQDMLKIPELDEVEGENHFVIAPNPGGHFTHASMTYDSAYGKVSCNWEKKYAGIIPYSNEGIT